jgi:hypothetical protein
MEEWRSRCRLINYILTEHDKQQAKITPVKLIDGDDIMDKFDLAPGPLVGRLLATIHEAHASGEISTREEALALVQTELSAVSKQKTRVTQSSRNSAAKVIHSAKVD